MFVRKADATLYPPSTIVDGGPLLVADKFVGFSSYNHFNKIGSCDREIPWLYLDLLYYKLWIEEHVPDLNEEWK